MVATIAGALARVKEELPELIEDHVLNYLGRHGEWVWRARLLDPLTTTLLLITQVLHGNTAITHLRHLAGLTASATAYCQARMRLPLAMLEQLCAAVGGELIESSDDDCRWHGHRLWHGDGTGFSMPDTPALADHFGRPGGQAPGCGFPVASLLVLCNAAGFIVKTLVAPLRTHDASQLHRLYAAMQAGDVLVYDRAACSYAHLALVLQHHLHAIFRMHQKQIVSFRPGRKHARQLAKADPPDSGWGGWVRAINRCAGSSRRTSHAG